MSTTKVINHLSVDNLNLNEVLSQQDKFFVNDDLILILNGSVQRIPVFSKEEIYQMVEPRLFLVLEGSAEVCINLQDYHIEKGNVMLSPADTIVEVNKISDDARVTVIVFRDSIEMSDEVVYKTSPAEFDRLLRMYYLLWDVVHLSPYRRKTVQYLSKTIVADVQELNEVVAQNVQNEGSTRTQELFLQFKTADKTVLCTGTLNSLLCLSTACNATSSFCDDKEGKWAECDVLDKSSHHTRGKATAEN